MNYYLGYETHPTEPKHKNIYAISPEFDEALLDNSILLKMRVKRNMKKIRRQYNEPRNRRYVRRAFKTPRPFHHRPAHIY